MRSMLVVTAIAFLGATQARAAPDSTDVHARIGQVLAAYGGREALAKVRGYRLEGELLTGPHGPPVPTVRVFERPDRFKVMIAYDQGAEARFVDGANGWRAEGGDPVEPVEGPMLDAMTLQAARADLPWILAERESLVRVIEPLERDSVTLAGLAVPLRDGIELRVYVEPRSGRIVASHGVLDRGPMRMTFETYYSDVREVHGVRFAFHEETWAAGTRTAEVRVRAITLNPPIHAGDFAPAAADSAGPGRRRGSKG